MTQEEIIKAFNNRWRIKREANADVFDHLGGTYETLIRSICRDFFETGICLGEGEHCQPIPMSAIVKAAEEVAFDDFWNLYDKKVGRPKCEKLWSKLTMVERVSCLNYIPLYKHAQPDKQYRKNPETFLRNKSWNDELVFRNDKTSNRAKQRLEKLADILTT